MRIRALFYTVFFVALHLSGCVGTVQEIITCDPPQADIYWGENPEQLFVTGHKTPYSGLFPFQRGKVGVIKSKRTGTLIQKASVETKRPTVVLTFF